MRRTPASSATWPASSSQLGAEFANKLVSPALKTSDLEASLQGYAEQEQQAYDQAQRIRAPGPLRQAHQRLLDALALRAKGLAGLSEALAQALAVKSAASSSTLTGVLTAQAQLLTTSDVVWDQLFRTATTEQIKAQGVTGLAVPESHFIANTDLVGARSFGLLLQRLHPVSTTASPAQSCAGWAASSTSTRRSPPELAERTRLAAPRSRCEHVVSEPNRPARDGRALLYPGPDGREPQGHA